MLRLNTYIRRFSEVRILCVGDVMLDTFLYGSVNRISPEAPVPVFKMGTRREMLGGAGNVVANLSSLECRTAFVGVVGQDGEGDKVESFLRQTACESSLIREKGYPTTMKTRFVAENHHLLRADQEETLNMSPSLRSRLLEAVRKEIPASNVVLLSDYGKGLFTKETTQDIITLCHDLGKTVIVDPKGADYSIYAGATLVKPNLKEFELVTGMTFNPSHPDFSARAVEGAKLLFSQFHIQNVLVTLSEHGMVFISSNAPDDFIRIPTVAREVFDVSGAGDTSLATLGAAVSAGANMTEAMQLANIASGIVVGKLGTACVTQDELNTALIETAGKMHNLRTRSNILCPEDAVHVVNSLKKSGKTVGFTNGCFDLLHLGHLHSFMQAKQECDILIVGLNSDASVKRLKGPSRPINDQDTRALMLASLEYIDYVVIFDDDTALPLIDLLKPDVIAKEGYPIEKWPEGQRVLSYGGRAVQLDRVDGYSTTSIVHKLQHNNS